MVTRYLYKTPKSCDDAVIILNTEEKVELQREAVTCPHPPTHTHTPPSGQGATFQGFQGTSGLPHGAGPGQLSVEGGTDVLVVQQAKARRASDAALLKPQESRQWEAKPQESGQWEDLRRVGGPRGASPAEGRGVFYVSAAPGNESASMQTSARLGAVRDSRQARREQGKLWAGKTFCPQAASVCAGQEIPQLS